MWKSQYCKNFNYMVFYGMLNIQEQIGKLVLNYLAFFQENQDFYRIYFSVLDFLSLKYYGAHYTWICFSFFLILKMQWALYTSAY